MLCTIVLTSTLDIVSNEMSVSVYLAYSSPLPSYTFNIHTTIYIIQKGGALDMLGSYISPRNSFSRTYVQPSSNDIKLSYLEPKPSFTKHRNPR